MTVKFTNRCHPPYKGVAEKSDLFRRETWRPFLKARRENVKVHKEYPDVLLFQT